MASPLGSFIETVSPCQLGGQSYLELALTQALDRSATEMLGSLAMTTAFFKLHQRIGDFEGPFLEPLETHFVPSQPPELITTRRYRGKTNELFTHWLCNMVKFSSAFAQTPWEEITVFDPLAGGGTTLFTALTLGAQTVAGVEQDAKNGKSTATFLKQFANEYHIPVRLKEERLKKLGRRWTVSLGESPELRTARHLLSSRDVNHQPSAPKHNGKTSREQRNAADRQSFVWAQGDAAQSRELLAGLKPHLIVADLPYGIQHQGALVTLLKECIPGWASMLRKGGAIALAWDATRFSAAEMHELLRETSDLQILNEPPYDGLEHRVDRVIKRRDVVLLRS